MPARLRVNGGTHEVAADGETPLLYVLRNDLALTGPRFGCGKAQCGACTVLLDGRPVPSCVTPLETVGDGEVTTLEGLGNPENPHPVQAAFLAEQAAQCGYCTAGMIMSVAGLLAETPMPSDDQIRAALAGNLCRCGTYSRIFRAVHRASGGGSSDDET